MSKLKMTQEVKDAMVEFLETMPNLTVARKLFGVGTSTVSKARESDPEFGRRVKAAISAGWDEAEAEAFRRAVTGWQEPVFFQGVECGDIRKYDSSLLKFLLTHNKPKKYNPGAKVTVGDGEKVSFVFKIGGAE